MRRRNDCTTEQSVRLYHKFDNTQDSGCAQARAVGRDTVETMEEDARGSSCARAKLVEIVNNARVRF